MKKIVLVLSIILTAAILTGCGEDNSQSDVQSVAQPDSQQNEIIEGPIVDEMGTLESGVDNEKAGEELEDYKTVLNNEDRSLDDCNKLENDEYKEKCLAIVYTQLAEESIDDSLCAKITLLDLQKECVERVEDLKNPPVPSN